MTIENRSAASRRPTPTVKLCLVIGLAGAFALMLINLGHPDLTYWDESFHAIVARNFLKHPLMMTLYDAPWLSFNRTDWGSSHLWLHKPPLAMWQIALSYLLFGVNTLALRLPSAALSIASAYLTYRLAIELFDNQLAGLLAAWLQAFNPYIIGAVYGYNFSDHVDVALIFWLEVGFLGLARGLRLGRTCDFAVAGLGLGLAFLTKVFPAFIIAGVAVGLWATKTLWARAPRSWHIRLRDLLVLGGSSLAVVLPWVAVMWAGYRSEFKRNVELWLSHLTGNIESWAAPWDRHLFDYLIHEIPWMYTLAIMALAYITMRAVRGQRGELFLTLWAWGVLIPFSCAVTKPESATLIALPALLLALSYFLTRALQSDGELPLAYWAAFAVAWALIPQGESIVVTRDSLPRVLRIGFAPYLKANIFVVRQLTITVAVVVGGWIGHRFLNGRAVRWMRLVQRTAAVTVGVVLFGWYVNAAVRVVLLRTGAPSFRTMGTIIRQQFPPNVVFILDAAVPQHDPQNDGYQAVLMFWSDRSVYHTAYQLQGQSLSSIAAGIRSAGGLPFLVTDRSTVPFEAVPGLTEHRFRVYRLPDAINWTPPSSSAKLP